MSKKKIYRHYIDYRYEARGVACPDGRGAGQIKRRRLTPKQVARIRRKPYEKLPTLAAAYGLSTVAIFWCRHKYTYKDLP